ncbi:MAG: hypothetical protein K0R08_324 [Solimicrobium sp.]|jgi:hypothetical protein|nr:hypothetical protein [Solimicrobium sp.]
MVEMAKHRLRQLGYRWLAFSENPLFLLFEKMYQYNPEHFPDVVPHPDERGFLLTNFICPEFACYRGREIVFFNARHVSVYWIPGAEHSAGGYVMPGNYSVTVGGYAIRRPVELLIVKDDENTIISSTKLQMQSGTSLEGGLISFGVIAKELHCLAQKWFSLLHGQTEMVHDTQQLRNVIKAAQTLSGYTDLRTQAVLLQRRLEARS